MTTSSISVQFTPTGFTPTDEQRNIQGSRHRTNLVIANAGAAKTTTLALRIGEAISRGMAPEDILALTFTDEAKQVMQTRLTAIGIAYNTARRVRVQTVEEFSRTVLSRLEDNVPVSLHAAREQRAFALSALENVGPNNPDRADALDISTHNTAISQFLENLLRLKATMTLARDEAGTDPDSAAESLGIPLGDYLWAVEYERQRIDAFGYVEARGFFDATYDLACTLRATPEMHEALPAAFKLVVCDELHDVNEASFCIIESLLNVHKPYFVGVGDKDQVIYSHLGADCSFLQYRIAASFPGCVAFPLSMTYRHGPHLAYAMEAFKNKIVDSTLPLHTEIREAPYGAVPGACGQQVVQAILQWKNDGKALDGCCILLRDHHQSIEVENALMRAQVQYRTLTMKSYLRRDEILFLRGMLAIALGDFHNVASADTRSAIVEALATFAEVPLTPDELNEAKATISKDPATLEYFFKGQIQRVGNPAARTRIENAVMHLRGLESGAPAHTAFEAVCELVDMEKLARRLYVHPYEAAVVTKSVKGFIAAARDLKLNLPDFSAWIGAAEMFVGARPGKNMVLLDCVANVKGKEFEHVILPFLDQGEFPNPLRARPEEENLFYVAATRAKSRLTLIPTEDPAQRSPFIAQMQLTSTQNRANNAVRRNLALPTASVGQRDLKVAYANRDVVKALGAQWDRTRKVWYVPGHLDLEPFKNWLAQP
ncbi:ATP-dependent helicase [Achromobacter pulmonis]|nr:ATP-dependent helicase [Achromobacter pulmonis]